MTDRPIKRVLVLDNEAYIRDSLYDAFMRHAQTGPFTFEVTRAAHVEEGVEKVRASLGGQSYDVLVLDLAFSEDLDPGPGLSFAEALGLLRRLGQTVPVTIVFSGFVSDVPNAVQVMRSGAWDVIDKQSADDGDDAEGVFDRVVQSAVNRLQVMEAQERLNAVARRWVRQHLTTLREEHGGRILAIVHHPQPHVIASGKDVFELELELRSWRRTQTTLVGILPYLVEIPPLTMAQGPIYG